MTTESTLDIRRRLEVITPGPWTANCFLVTAKNGREVTHTGLLGRRHSSHAGRSGGEEDEANAEFIAHAPADIDYLLSLVDRLREALEPFAKWWDVVKDRTPPNRLDAAASHPIAWSGRYEGPIIDDCRCARKALEDSR